eukprot:11190134-Heterocapsa_arctica.AAC.1
MSWRLSVLNCRPLGSNSRNSTQGMPLPLSVLPREFAMSVCVAIRTSSGPFTSALMAVATLASKERHLGAM